MSDDDEESSRPHSSHSSTFSVSPFGEFPPAIGKEYILRTVINRPAPWSRPSPQRMYCVLTTGEFRLAGAFTSDTSFVWLVLCLIPSACRSFNNMFWSVVDHWVQTNPQRDFCHCIKLTSIMLSWQILFCVLPDYIIVLWFEEYHQLLGDLSLRPPTRALCPQTYRGFASPDLLPGLCPWTQ